MMKEQTAEAFVFMGLLLGLGGVIHLYPVVGLLLLAVFIIVILRRA